MRIKTLAKSFPNKQSIALIDLKLMKCRTCNAELPPKKPKGRNKVYCSRTCNPNAYQIRGAGLTHCQVCSKEIEPSKTGRPKRNCSQRCRDLAAQANRPKKPKVKRPCSICGKEFLSANQRHNYCSSTCRAEFNRRRSSEKWRKTVASRYPNQERTTICGWCNEPRTFKIGESVANAYHPACSKEAQRARYRIKTVKRQKHKSPQRISHEQVVREYGSDCHICKEPIDLNLPRTSKLGLTVDHLIPLSRGGTDTMPNLRPAHWGCNIKKSNKLMEELSA